MSWLDLIAAGCAGALLVSLGFASGTWWASARIRTLLGRASEQDPQA